MRETSKPDSVPNYSEKDFQTIYSSFSKKVYSTALGYTQNILDAEEITQDVFVEVHQKIGNFKGESSLSTWIYRITTNKCLDFIKHRNRKKRFAIITSLFNNDGELTVDPPDFVHPGITLENVESAQILFKAINKLPENQKTAFILSKIEGLSYSEIAETMKLRIPAVESLLFRSKANLKKLLGSYYDHKM